MSSGRASGLCRVTNRTVNADRVLNHGGQYKIDVDGQKPPPQLAILPHYTLRPQLSNNTISLIRPKGPCHCWN